MPEVSSATQTPSHLRKGVLGLGFSALGIVFGDIGTSPLYTLKTVLNLTGSNPSPEVVLGVLSLILWTLVIVTTIKYVGIAMSIDNDGEGGILALMSLLGIKKQHRPIIVAMGLFGAALIYGDGVITPAISVLSALEGLNIAVPGLTHYVLPASVAVLVALFVIQPLGTSRIGKAFGPIMMLWFVSIAVLGVWGIVRYPAVLAAVNPIHGLRYLFSHGYASFLVLGGVFLCVTGAEALYADMGHFGRLPIRLAWSGIVFPSLLLNYAGQAAIVLDGVPTSDNIFFRLCPSFALLPLVVLATFATIIASQSIITGAFSMTRQAILLGWLPRLRIIQTSSEGYGQIYVGAINWLLAFATISLTIVFGKSDNLAAAYGIAVSLTMFMTSALLYIAMREVWGWSRVPSAALAAVLLSVDGAFFCANAVKVLGGGYVPLLLATVVYGAMWIWHRGTKVVAQTIGETLTPIDTFLTEIEKRHIPRVPGSAIFITRTLHDTPPVMKWHVKMNRSLHKQVLILTVVIESVPWVTESKRLIAKEFAPDLWRATVHYGFMDRPDLISVLRETKALGCPLHLDDVTFYVGRETITRAEKGSRLPGWEAIPYAWMVRNAARINDVLHLPSGAVVEIGREIAI